MKGCITAKEIDALLPQTQCGLCGYNGCMPYAVALEKNQATINLCPPGGVKGLIAIGDLLEVDPAPYISEMEEKAKPSLLAVIRKAECIGCTKCIAACPVDAIVGAAKQMHTVIVNDCTGCELCVAPCPVDCIDMLVIPSLPQDTNYYRDKHIKHNLRLTQQQANPTIKTIDKTVTDKQAYITAALERVKNKKI